MFKNWVPTVIYIILNRFSDLLGMDIPIWVSIPFKVNVAEIELSLQEPLIKLQSDEIMRAKFKDGKYNIWKTNDVATMYPFLWDKAQFYVIAFPTSYLVEAGFSHFSQILSKARNRLDIVKRCDLRLPLTSIEPNIKKLVEKLQPQGSHWINMLFFNHTLNFNCFFIQFTQIILEWIKLPEELHSPWALVVCQSNKLVETCNIAVIITIIVILIITIIIILEYFICVKLVFI